MQHYPARRSSPLVDDEGESPKAFGDIVTADHIILGNDADDDNNCALVVLDRATRYLAAYPQKAKATEETLASLRHFSGQDEVKLFYSDNAPELLGAAREMKLEHRTSTPGRPSSNGVAERAVKSVLEGSRCLLSQANLPMHFWPAAVRCFTHLHNVTFKGNTNVTPWQARFGVKFPDKDIHPFGCIVDYKPSPVKGKVLHKFEPHSAKGVFLGYHLVPGSKWKGDFHVVALQDYYDGNFNSVQRVKEVYRERGVTLVFSQKAIERSDVVEPAALVDPEQDEHLSPHDSDAPSIELFGGDNVFKITVTDPDATSTCLLEFNDGGVSINTVPQNRSRL